MKTYTTAAVISYARMAYGAFWLNCSGLFAPVDPRPQPPGGNRRFS